jgi:hypothetical protein
MSKVKSIFLAQLGVILVATGALAISDASRLAPKGSFSDYGFSRDYKSFDPKDPVNAKRLEDGDGEVPRVSAKPPSAATINSASTYTIVTVPLGWYALDEGNQTRIVTPDEKTRFIMHFEDIAPSKSFDQFKKSMLAEMEGQLKPSQPNAKFDQFDLPDGSIAVEIKDLVTKSGSKNGMVTVITPNPRSKESRYAMSISLTTPQADLPKYEGLLGLMLKSRKVMWEYSH